MTNIDPKEKYSRTAVANYDDGEMLVVKPGKLNDLAARIAAEYRVDTVSPAMLTGFMRLGEALVLFAIGIAIMVVYVGVKWTPVANGLVWHYLLSSAIGAVLTIAFFQVLDLYQTSALRRSFRTFPKVLLAWTSTFAILLIGAFFLKISEDFSRVWLASWYIGGVIFLFFERLMLNFCVRRWGRNGIMERRAVIVGGGKPAEKLIRSIEQQADNDIRICGLFDDRDDLRSPPIVAGYPKLGNIEELVEFSRRARISMLIVALPLDAEDRVLAMLKKLWVLPVDIRLSAHSNNLRFRPRTYSYVGNIPMFDIFDRPIRDWDSVAKRAFDIFFSVLGITLLSPIMLGAYLAVKLTSKGPAIFVQERHGFNNEIIRVYKFRSMFVDQQDLTARKSVTKGDPRVTPVGRIIRKTSIDELPQFFNALRGDLSLVGPRPHAVHAQTREKLYGEVVDGYFARHRVKPGVTGWAQINGWRGEIDHDDKIKMRTECDLYYIENWSLMFDLRILFMTPISLFTKSDNAY
ncbi:undecaprenyl-phosphate glucose phosphotransferase [Ahrensia sp. 13_GOM-1096m]|uniref:undecaprenyl-phosphate glucose phosphotransferase n=1 Tax=Ahrensia sp. 13_GOM-1096m TaxID=1380380 RepID=UPI00047E0C78|nr:undecaprenyl-phosphate glucose phosphotransferase [Ahrensia sp. 13_GOM-1096m]